MTYKILLLFIAYTYTTLATSANCFTILDKSDRVILRSQTAPIDLANSISIELEKKYPGTHLVWSRGEGKCEEQEFNSIKSTTPESKKIEKQSTPKRVQNPEPTTQNEVIKTTQNAGDPIKLFKIGSLWESNALATTFDKFSEIKYELAGNKIALNFNGKKYTITTKKRNDTDIPAIYRIENVTTQNGENFKAAPDLSKKIVSCTDVGAQAKAKGHSFMDMMNIMDAAKKAGNCQ